MPKYSQAASDVIEKALHKFKRGKLKSSSGDTVTSRDQALAIGISQAREKHLKVPQEPKKE